MQVSEIIFHQVLRRNNAEAKMNLSLIFFVKNIKNEWQKTTNETGKSECQKELFLGKIEQKGGEGEGIGLKSCCWVVCC